MRSILPSLLCLLAALCLLSVFRPCYGYRMVSSYPQQETRGRQLYGRPLPKNSAEDDDTFPKLGSDMFGYASGEAFDGSRSHEDNDSLSAADEANLADLTRELTPRLSKRRKGPTLSVVNPLEILRQRLMLDLARRRIHENQQQIVANAQLLENIGKRSVSGQEAHFREE